MRVLLIASNEICFNPRLVKAADCFLEEGWEVTVYSPYLGNIARGRYDEYVRRRDWKVLGFDLSRQSPQSWVRWILASVIHRVCAWMWAHGSRIGFPYALSKSPVGLRSDPAAFDIVLLNLVDNLPAAVALKRKDPKLKIIYDSQEYFQGQYSTENEHQRRWVAQAENEGIASVDYLLATTNVMKARLEKELPFSASRSFRVRNVPYEAPRVPGHHLDNLAGRPLRLVWHGLKVYYRNRRGLYLIVEALAAARCDAELFVQGIPVENEVAELKREAIRLGILDRIHVVDPADPDRIVESLLGYDVGVAPEVPEEENQLLTSSNKLFEYIAAGLATLTADLPGLRETVAEFDTGLLFEPGNVRQLADAIERLSSDRELLSRFRRNSLRASVDALSWKRDFEPVLAELRRIMPHISQP